MPEGERKLSDLVSEIDAIVRLSTGQSLAVHATKLWNNFGKDAVDGFVKSFIAKSAAWPQAYVMLGVAPTVSDAMVRLAYRVRSKEVHPDIHPELGDIPFRELKVAYEQICKERGVKA